MGCGQYAVEVDELRTSLNPMARVLDGFDKSASGKTGPRLRYMPDAEQRIARTVPDRLIEITERGRVLPTEGQRDAEIAAREGEIGIEGDHSFEAANRLIVVAEEQFKNCQRRVGKRILIVGQNGRAGRLANRHKRIRQRGTPAKQAGIAHHVGRNDCCQSALLTSQWIFSASHLGS